MAMNVVKESEKFWQSWGNFIGNTEIMFAPWEYQVWIRQEPS
jgi:hypothetical protein